MCVSVHAYVLYVQLHGILMTEEYKNRILEIWNFGKGCLHLWQTWSYKAKDREYYKVNGTSSVSIKNFYFTIKEEWVVHKLRNEKKKRN